MRFAVPQFIDIEDKIFGPFTWRQAVYLGGGIGFFVIMFIVFDLFLAVLLSIPVLLLVGALSFYPINNRPFSYFLEAIWTYFTSSRLYLWRQKEGIVYRDTTSSNRANSNPLVNSQNRGNTHKSITSLTRDLELKALQKD
jgi:hypothetical protein